MENKNEKALDNFLTDEEKKAIKNTKKKIVMKEREGLIERVDPIIVTEDGKQLLREQY